MKPPLIGFPTRYIGLPAPEGQGWLDAAAKAYPKLASGGIVAFYGTRGTGKTRMAYELAATGGFPDPMFPGDRWPRPAIYKTAMDMFLAIRGTYRSDSKRSEEQVMAEFSEAVLLVIDEMQVRGESVFEDQKLTTIIDARYQHSRPTIIAANYTKAEFTKSISPSIVSRIQECGGGIHFNWPSYRLATPHNPGGEHEG